MEFYSVGEMLRKKMNNCLICGKKIRKVVYRDFYNNSVCESCVKKNIVRLCLTRCRFFYFDQFLKNCPICDSKKCILNTNLNIFDQYKITLE